MDHPAGGVFGMLLDKAGAALRREALRCTSRELFYYG
jgi:hypothetical protein